jgi:hypothetical protein
MSVRPERGVRVRAARPGGRGRGNEGDDAGRTLPVAGDPEDWLRVHGKSPGNADGRRPNGHAMERDGRDPLPAIGRQAEITKLKREQREVGTEINANNRVAVGQCPAWHQSHKLPRTVEPLQPADA